MYEDYLDALEWQFYYPGMVEGKQQEYIPEERQKILSALELDEIICSR